MKQKLMKGYSNMFSKDLDSEINYYKMNRRNALKAIAGGVIGSLIKPQTVVGKILNSNIEQNLIKFINENKSGFHYQGPNTFNPKKQTILILGDVHGKAINKDTRFLYNFRKTFQTNSICLEGVSTENNNFTILGAEKQLIQQLSSENYKIIGLSTKELYQDFFKAALMLELSKRILIHHHPKLWSHKEITISDNIMDNTLHSLGFDHTKKQSWTYLNLISYPIIIDLMKRYGFTLKDNNILKDFPKIYKAVGPEKINRPLFTIEYEEPIKLLDQVYNKMSKYAVGKINNYLNTNQNIRIVPVIFGVLHLHHFQKLLDHNKYNIYYFIREDDLKNTVEQHQFKIVKIKDDIPSWDELKRQLTKHKN